MFLDKKELALKKGRLSGGLSVYFRKELKNEISVIETNNFGIIWLKINHTIFSSNNDLYLFMYIFHHLVLKF